MRLIHKQPYRWSLLAGCVIAFLSSDPLANAIVTPFPGGILEGNSSSYEPFGRGHAAFDPPSTRYQQVAESTDFSWRFPGGVVITEIAFRADIANQGFFNAFLPGVQFNLSVTPRGADELSPNFAENIGLHEQIVLPTTRLQIPVGPGHSIPLATPYFYNPAEGNLLIDIRNFGPPDDSFTRLGLLDAFNDPSDSISRVFSHDVNALSGTADTVGLTMFFVVTPVPEPSSAALSVAGFVLAGFWLVRTRRRMSKAHECH